MNDILTAIGNNGYIATQIVIVVGHVVYLTVTQNVMKKELSEHKKDTSELITQIQGRMSHNDDIFAKLRDDMAVVLTSLKYIEKRLDEIKK